MSKTSIGLLLAAALTGLPAVSLAQAKPKQPKAEPAAAEPPAKEEPAAAEAAGAEAGDDAAEEPEEDTGGGLAEICKLDPDSCPQVDMNKEAQKDLGAEIYAMQQVFALRRGRFEVNPYWSFTLNDQFVGHPGPGLQFTYYFTNVMGIGLNGNYYEPFNVDSQFNAVHRRAARVGVPLTEYQWAASLNFAYVPATGKFAGFGDFIFHYDVYVLLGMGAISTRPIAVIDPDNRNFEYKPKLSIANPGLGLRIFFNRWFGAMLEVRDYIYLEELENLSIAANARDESTWLQESAVLTHNVQAQLGVSIFIPFSFEYRLPK